MKNLLLFLLIAGAAGLFFHDKQQTADLAAEQAANAQLTQQLSDANASVNGLKFKVQQLTTELAQLSPQAAFPGRPAGAPGPDANHGAWIIKDSGGLQGSGLQDTDSLDRPAYH